MSADWRLNIAYNAALQAATVALYACGFRASREAHRYRIIQSLKFTLKPNKDVVRQLDQFRKKRNRSDYERSGEISDAEAKEMLELAAWLKDAVIEWIAQDYPELKV